MENAEIEKHNCALDELYRKRDEALKRVVLISENRNTLKEDQELEKALDVLTVAHTTATFEYCSGPFESGLRSGYIYCRRLMADEANHRAEPITADDVRRIRQQYFGSLKSELTEGSDD